MKTPTLNEVKAGVPEARQHDTTDDLLAGRTVRILDIPRDQRPEAIAALAVLRDELPIKTTWRTYSESHLSETRLRARCYWIAPEYLHEVLEVLPCN